MSAPSKSIGRVSTFPAGEASKLATPGRGAGRSRRQNARPSNRPAFGRGGGQASQDGVLEPEELAEVVIETLREERFLVLPHPDVLTYFQRKASDYDRWLSGMRRFRRRLIDNRAS